MIEAPRFIQPNKPPQELMPGILATLEMPKPKPRRKPTNGTARHEAKHVVAAMETGTSVSKVTIIPGEGYLGLTVLSSPNAVAALAPHATGESGTSHDVRIASMIGGLGSESIARSIIENNMDKVDAVACALEDSGSLNWYGIKSALSELKKPKIEFGVLTVKLESGEEVKEEVKVKDNIIMDEGVWYKIAAKAAPQVN